MNGKSNIEIRVTYTNKSISHASEKGLTTEIVSQSVSQSVFGSFHLTTISMFQINFIFVFTSVCIKIFSFAHIRALLRWHTNSAWATAIIVEIEAVKRCTVYICPLFGSNSFSSRFICVVFAVCQAKPALANVCQSTLWRSHIYTPTQVH